MELKKGYKQTDVGVIPEDWDLKTILQIAKYNDAGIKIGPFGSALKKELLVKEGYKVYGQENIFENDLSIGDRYIKKSHFQKLKSCELYSGDFIISMMGTIGKSMIVPKNFEKGIMDSHLIRIKIDDDLADKGYFKHYFSFTTTLRQIKSLSVGGIMEGLSSKIIKKIYIPLPPTLREQKAIAQVLTDTDQLIQNLKTLIAKKKAIKQGAMQELLTGKKRLKGFEGEWNNKKLAEVASIQRGASPRPIKDPIWFDQKSKVGWVRISDVTKSKKYLSKTIQKLSEDGIANSRYVASDSLIMSICATIGRPIITKINVCVHDGFVVFDGLKIDKSYLYYYLTFIEDDWSKNGQTGSQMNLNTGLINETKLNFPEDQNEQKAIAQILSDMDTEIEALETQLQKTQNLKQGMMQELLTGKIRLVKPVNQATKKSTPIKLKAKSESEIPSIAAEPEADYKIEKPHNEHITDAVLIGTMADAFGSNEFPLTRFMYTKVSYLLKRFKEEEDNGYLKKAAGPYKPKTRYGGAEKIALQNRYVKKHISNYKGKKYENFVAGDNCTQAIEYFKKWYGENALQWIQQFKFTKRNQLELCATVDMAMQDLLLTNRLVNFQTVKQLINDDKEWRPKLKRPTFSDENIKSAIIKVNQLFG